MAKFAWFTEIDGHVRKEFDDIWDAVEDAAKFGVEQDILKKVVVGSVEPTIPWDAITAVDVAMLREEEGQLSPQSLIGMVYGMLPSLINEAFVLLKSGAEEAFQEIMSRGGNDDDVLAWCKQYIKADPDTCVFGVHPLPLGFRNGHWCMASDEDVWVDVHIEDDGSFGGWDWYAGAPASWGTCDSLREAMSLASGRKGRSR